MKTQRVADVDMTAFDENVARDFSPRAIERSPSPPADTMNLPPPSDFQPREAFYRDRSRSMLAKQMG
jgi:hypothetical protein